MLKNMDSAEKFCAFTAEACGMCRGEDSEKWGAVFTLKAVCL